MSKEDKKPETRKLKLTKPQLVGKHWYSKGDVVEVPKDRAKTMIAREAAEAAPDNAKVTEPGKKSKPADKTPEQIEAEKKAKADAAKKKAEAKKKADAAKKKAEAKKKADAAKK